MSKIVSTKYGRFNKVATGWLWECPKCKSWGALSDAQFEGIISVVCSGPQGDGGCDYHETHSFGNELLVTMQARFLTGDPVFDVGASAVEA